MSALKYKRVFIPFEEVSKCVFCLENIKNEAHTFTIINDENHKHPYHQQCLSKILKTKAVQALSADPATNLKKSCLCCGGDTHLPDIDDKSLNKLGLNSLSFLIHIGKSKRTVKIHKACLISTALKQQINFPALLSRAKLHKLKAIQTKDPKQSNPLCSLCYSEVSLKKGNAFITNNMYFHKNCIQSLIEEVFTMKTASAHFFNAADLKEFSNSCVFCKKSQSLDNLTLQVNKPVHLNPDRLLSVGFHRECLLAFTKPVKKTG